MLKIRLDIGTEFVKCVLDYSQVRLPSIYAEDLRKLDGQDHRGGGCQGTVDAGNDGRHGYTPIHREKPDSEY